MTNIKVICGLGNPGLEFVNTPHNAGFKVLDLLETSLKEYSLFSEQDKTFEYIKYERNGQMIYLVRTLSYMNLSGQALKQFFEDTKLKINLNADLLIIHDELDIDIGKIKITESGSAGNNNGCKNVNEALSLNNNWNRIKVGTKPAYQVKDKIAYVLRAMSLSEQADALVGEAKACCAAIDWLDIGIQKTMNKYNTKVFNDNNGKIEVKA